MLTIIYGTQEPFESPGLLVDPTAIGWEAKPQGLCYGALCVPFPLEDGRVDVGAFADRLGQPIIREGDVLAFGEPRRPPTLDAPDFTLPDVDGHEHSLSETLGKKVMLVSWASWCGCREDLPVWQVLVDELEGFTVVSVALDADASKAIAISRRYATTYPILIDQRHTVAELYGMVNVPSAIWIDEEGHVARPTHVAGMSEDFRYHADRANPSPEIPDGARPGMQRTRDAYMDAVRRWVRHGEHERRDALPDHDDSAAHAHFRLATYLREHGLEGAQAHFAEAVRLRPASWNFRRQALALERPDDFWDQFWGAVDATPPGQYYPLDDDLQAPSANDARRELGDTPE